MDSNMSPNETPQQMYQQYGHVEGELDLLDVWRILLHKKWLILGGTFFCTMLAVVFALLLPSEYRAEIILLPPLAETVGKLNVPNLDDSNDHSSEYFFKVDPMKLYDALIENLQSYQLQWQFFKENELLARVVNKEETRTENEIFEKKFREKFALKGIRKNKGARGAVTISLEGKEPEQIASWLNDFVPFIDKYTISTQIKAFSTKMDRRESTLLQRIESLRSSEKTKRLDMVVRLEEALVVATKLGWLEQPDNLGTLYEGVSIDDVKVSFSLQEMPLYLRGSKALQAEIDTLKQRKNDDSFIPKLRSLQEQLKFLSSVTQDTENVHAMRIDRPAVLDERAVKPKRKLIVALGIVLGLFLFVLVAFIQNMVAPAK